MGYIGFQQHGRDIVPTHTHTPATHCTHLPHLPSKYTLCPPHTTGITGSPILPHCSLRHTQLAKLADVRTDVCHSIPPLHFRRIVRPAPAKKMSLISPSSSSGEELPRVAALQIQHLPHSIPDAAAACQHMITAADVHQGHTAGIIRYGISGRRRQYMTWLQLGLGDNACRGTITNSQPITALRLIA